MKRCIICGNVGDDNSTKCDVCGNPFIDTTGKTPEEMKMASAVEPDEESIKATFVHAVEASGQAAQAAKNKAAQAEKENIVQEKQAQPVVPETHKRECAVTAPETEPVKAEAQQRKARETAPETGPVKTEAQQSKTRAAVSETEPVKAEAQQRKTQAAAPEMQNRQIYSDAQRTPHRAQSSSSRPVRRMKSGPQVYGQEGSETSARGYDHQGTIRRDVQHVPQQAAQNRQPQRQDSQARVMQGQKNTQPQMGVQGQPGVQRQMNAQRQPNQQGRPMYQGQPMGQPPYSQPQRQGMPVQAAGTKMAAPSDSYQARQIQEVSRGMLRSPIFLLIAILNTVCFAGTIAAIFLREMNYSQVIRLIKEFDLPAQISGYVGSVTSVLSMLDSGALFANLAMHIPDLLFVIGLWLVFAAALKSGEGMSGIGFGFVKATVIINMIVACVVSAFILIVTVAVVIASWVSGTMPVIIGAAAALVIAIAVVMMVIMYYFCHLATIKTCRLNSIEGESYGKVSRYVAIIHIVLGLVSVVDLLSGIVNSELSNIVGSIGKIGWLLLFAIWIFMYRDKMEEIGE